MTTNFETAKKVLRIFLALKSSPKFHLDIQKDPDSPLLSILDSLRDNSDTDLKTSALELFEVLIRITSINRTSAETLIFIDINELEAISGSAPADQL